MEKPYNPQDGSKYVYLLSKSITDRGDKMTGSFRGGKTKHKNMHKYMHKSIHKYGHKTISKKKRYRYTNETTHDHKKQHTRKSKKRSRR